MREFFNCIKASWSWALDDQHQLSKGYLPIFFSLLLIRGKSVASPFLLVEKRAQRVVLINFGSTSKKTKLLIFIFFFQTWTPTCPSARRAAPVPQGKGTLQRHNMVRHFQISGRADLQIPMYKAIFLFPHSLTSEGYVQIKRRGMKIHMKARSKQLLFKLSHTSDLEHWGKVKRMCPCYPNPSIELSHLNSYQHSSDILHRKRKEQPEIYVEQKDS